MPAIPSAPATTSASSAARRCNAPMSRRRLLLGGPRRRPRRSTRRRRCRSTRVFEAAEAQAAGGARRAGARVNVFLPGGVDLLDTLVPLDQFGRYADLRPALGASRPPPLGSHRPRRCTRRSRDGRNGGVKGLFDAREDRLPPRHRLREPRPLALQLAPLLGDRDRQPALGAAAGSGAGSTAGHADNPLQGLTMGGGAVAASCAGGAPVAAGRQPARRAAAVRRHVGQGLDADDGGLGAGGIADAAPARPGPAAVGARRAPGRARSRDARALRAATGDGPIRSPRRSPTRGQRPRHASCQRARRRCSRSPLGHPRRHRRGRRRLRHARRPAGRARDRRSPRLSQALSAFQADLEMRGLADRVLTFVWRSSGAGRRRTTRRAPTTAPAASRGCRAPARAAGSSPTTRPHRARRRTATSP